MVVVVALRGWEWSICAPFLVYLTNVSVTPLAVTKLLSICEQRKRIGLTRKRPQLPFLRKTSDLPNQEALYIHRPMRSSQTTGVDRGNTRVQSRRSGLQRLQAEQGDLATLLTLLQQGRDRGSRPGASLKTGRTGQIGISGVITSMSSRGPAVSHGIAFQVPSHLFVLLITAYADPTTWRTGAQPVRPSMPW